MTRLVVARRVALLAMITAVSASTIVSNEVIYDDFSTYNSTVWDYSDGEFGSTDGSKTWYLKNHSHVNATLSSRDNQQPTGLVMVMSDDPCKSNPDVCHGAKMCADHLTATSQTLYGDYELRMRAPYTANGDGKTCTDGIYAYFTAGYVNTGGVWNEMNFGFHPDRDNNGTSVSCEHHDDTGGYKETSVDVGFNYRENFHTWVIKLRKDSLEWLVDGKTLHHTSAKLTQPMTTRLILRTNYRAGDPGYMPTANFEIAHFKFTPSNG
eukprot:m.204886 g.204886  ORF g.204886 m.204886 type:complete len:266 (-) comp32903_c5_seq8:155-952(-)